jgi:membrane protein implicated in regulation of membrane protease activity
MALILFLVLVALVLGIIGVVVKGMFYLLIIGIAVLVAALAYAALRWRRTGRRPAR